MTLDKKASQPVSGVISDRLRNGIEGVDPLASPRAEEAVPTNSIQNWGFAMGRGWMGVPWVSPSYERYCDVP